MINHHGKFMGILFLCAFALGKNTTFVKNLMHYVGKYMCSVYVFIA